MQKELLEIALRYDHKEFKKELDRLCQVQIELTKSEIELENSKKEQREAQIISPTSPNFD